MIRVTSVFQSFVTSTALDSPWWLLVWEKCCSSLHVVATEHLGWPCPRPSSANSVPGRLGGWADRMKRWP